MRGEVDVKTEGSGYWQRPVVVLIAGLLMSCATVAGSCIDSESCCIEAHPGNPAACGLTEAEAAALIGTAAAAGAATTATLAAQNEGWKQQCIDTYVKCKSENNPLWVGDCYACLRRCEGQRQWPFALCHPR